ncbi:hypothetical protein SLS55_006046 [Diplodia seriata]|uniref:Uncharacterized protein n=1 Tax=Diplodia seriata TaxID=420778 RepID=A0ABR3CGH2_9PEZI
MPKHHYSNVYCIKPDFITPGLIQVYFANVHINLYSCFIDIFFDLNHIESATTAIFFGFSFIFDKTLYDLTLHILILDKFNLHNSYIYKCHSPSLEYFHPALVQKHSIRYFDLIIYHTVLSWSHNLHIIPPNIYTSHIWRCNHTTHNHLDALDSCHKSSYDFKHIACPSSNHSPGHNLYIRSYDSFFHNTYYGSCRILYHRPHHEANNTTNNNSNSNSNNNSDNNSDNSLHSVYESFHVRSFNKHTIYDGPFNESAFNVSSGAPTTSYNFDAAYRLEFTAVTNSAISYNVSKQFFSK